MLVFKRYCFPQYLVALETFYPSGQKSRTLQKQLSSAAQACWLQSGLPIWACSGRRLLVVNLKTTGRFSFLGSLGPMFRKKPIHISLTEQITAMLELLFSSAYFMTLKEIFFSGILN